MAFIIYNNLVIESNPQISVYEQGEWTDKGQYAAAVMFDEDIEWIKKKKDYILPVCYVSYFYSLYQDYLIYILYQEHLTPLGSTGTTPLHTCHSTPLGLSATTSSTISSLPMVSSHTGSPFKDKIIASLGIPIELTDHKDISLGHAWQKYKVCLAAIKTCNSLWESQKLREVFDQRPTQADIISVFKGKSQWHLTYSKAFPKLSGFPTMVSWLEDSDDKLSDAELWGVSKSVYTFSDLLEWLANGGEGLTKMKTETGSDIKETQKEKEKKKGKGKEKEKRKEKEKEEEKNKRNDKGKVKAKEVTGGKKKKTKAGV